MKTRRLGFTVLEMVIVLMIGGLLTSISVSAFGEFRQRLAQRQAQRAFQGMHAQARVMAIESGQVVSFHLDSPGDSIWIERNDSVLDRIHIEDEFGVDLGASDSRMEICFDARGLGNEACTSYSTIKVAFFRGVNMDNRYLFLLPLGGIVEQSGL